MKKKSRRVLIFTCNEFHKKLITIIFSTQLITIIAFSLPMVWVYVKIVSLGDADIDGPEILNLLERSFLVMLYILPFIFIVPWWFSKKLVYKKIGAVERISLELRSRVQDSSTTPISIRKSDHLQQMVEDINILLNKKIF